jgi:hypothetical protein
MLNSKSSVIALLAATAAHGQIILSENFETTAVPNAPAFFNGGYAYDNAAPNPVRTTATASEFGSVVAVLSADFSASTSFWGAAWNRFFANTNVETSLANLTLSFDAVPQAANQFISVFIESFNAGGANTGAIRHNFVMPAANAVNSLSVPLSSFSAVSGSFNPTDASLQIVWRLDNDGGWLNAANQTVKLDNIVFQAGAIPEPASAAALLGLGVLGTAMLRRRRC